MEPPPPDPSSNESQSSTSSSPPPFHVFPHHAEVTHDHARRSMLGVTRMGVSRCGHKDPWWILLLGFLHLQPPSPSTHPIKDDQGPGRFLLLSALSIACISIDTLVLHLCSDDFYLPWRADSFGFIIYYLHLRLSKMEALRFASPIVSPWPLSRCVCLSSPICFLTGHWLRMRLMLLTTLFSMLTN